MGLQTVVGILNNHWHRFEADPSLLIDAINEGMHNGSNSSANAVTVHPSHHTDFPCLYLSWGNMLVNVNNMRNYSEDVRRQIILHVKDLLEQAEKLENEPLENADHET